MAYEQQPLPGLEEHPFILIDDGTLDTVIQNLHTREEFRFSPEYAAEWRNHRGELDLNSFVEDHEDELYDES